MNRQPLPVLPPIKLADALAKSQVKLARLCGVSPNTVANWVKTNCVSAEAAVIIEAAVGVHRSALRPDLWAPQDYPEVYQVAPLPEAEPIVSREECARVE